MSVRCILVLTVLSLWCASSRAQTGAKADSTQVTGLEEVSVVAVKQSSSLRGQPVAASIVTAPQLNHLNVVAIKGLSDVVPNFYIPDYGSRITSTIYVRGIGARIDQPSVGLNVDNVPVLNKNAYDFDLSDMVSVEMLRGPQSTLFGRNTMAGLINIQTLSPMSYQGWRLSVQTATNNPFRGSAGWYHRFGRNFGIAAIASFSASSGFYTNDYDSTKLDRERLFNFRLKAQWNPSRRLRISNAANIGMLRQGGYPYASVQTGKRSYNDTCFYPRMSDEKWKNFSTTRQLEKKVEADDNATDADYEEVSRAVTLCKEKDAEIERRYDACFKKFLTAKQIFKMKASEEKFRQKMKEMKREHRKTKREGRKNKNKQ